MTECRICKGKTFEVLNLGDHPLANKLNSSLDDSFQTYPLALLVCENCSGAQLSYCVDANTLYDSYLYITPVNETLTQHYQSLLGFLKERSYLNSKTKILEIGSNIGRFLFHLKDHCQSILGVDPAKNICELANKEGIPTVNHFFNTESAQSILEDKGQQDLIMARHCFAHNENPQAMLEGVNEILSDDGVVLIENAYFLDTVENSEFDQIYHEHMYYYNLRSISTMLNQYGLKLVDCMHSPIHGGSMVYIAKKIEAQDQPSDSVLHYLKKEAEMHRPEFYQGFKNKVFRNKDELCKLIKRLTGEGKVIHAYGASAKSVTLLNYYELNDSVIPYSVDSTPIKFNKYIPKANLKIISEEEAFKTTPPDYYLLTSWNYKDDIIAKVKASGNTKTQFITPHPEIQLIP